MEINHGQRVFNGKYAYLVNCGNTIPESLPKILSNTVNVQAVESANGRKIGIVSYNTSEKEVTSSIGRFNIDIKAALLVQQ